VDDVFAGQIVSVRNLRLAETEQGKRGTFLVKLLARHGVHGEVNAAVTDHMRVCRVHYGIDLHLCDVLSDNLKRHIFLLFDVMVTHLLYQMLNRLSTHIENLAGRGNFARFYCILGFGVL
jgi:hypothetical protein